MAESVRYQGRRVALRIPDAQAFEAQAIERGMGQLQQSLNRMTSFFAEQSRVQAKIKGEEYGAANAPTLEQIQDARETGEELKLPGNQNTLYGRAARQAAATVVASELELAAKQEMTAAILDFETREANPAGLQDKLDSIIQGYSSTFEESVPSMARSMKAKLALTANTKYTAYHGSYISNQKQKSIANFTVAKMTDIENLKELFNTKITKTDKNGNEIQVFADRDIFDALKQQMLEEGAARGVSASSLKSLAAMWDNGVQEAALEVISDEALIFNTVYGKSLYYDALSNGNISALPEKVQAAWATLETAQEKSSAIEIARQRWKQSVDDENTQNSLDIARYTKSLKQAEQFTNLYLNQYVTETDPVRKEEAFVNYENAVNALNELDAEKAKVHLPNLDAINFNGVTFRPSPTDDQETMAGFSERLFNFDETLSLTDINQAFIEGKLTLKTFGELSEKVESYLDKNFTNMLKDARAEAKLPMGGLFLSSADLNQDRLQKLNDFEKAARKARREQGGEFNAQDFFESNKAMLQEPEGSTDQARIGSIKSTYKTQAALEKQINVTPEGDSKEQLKDDLQFMIDNKGYEN